MPKLSVLVLLLLSSAALLQAQTFGPIPWPKPIRTLPDTATLVFLGDVMMHRDQIADAGRPDGTYDFSTYFRLLEDRIQAADIAVANMEFTLGGKPYTGYPCFSAPDDYADYVAGSGIDVFLTANNHILDKGGAGISRTLDIYTRMEREQGIKYTGSARNAEDDARNPLIVVAKGNRIALLNFTYGTNLDIPGNWPKVQRIDREALAAAIRRAREAEADFIIALPHWGTEYVLTHSESQRQLARWLAEQGCDAVIGSHPHVVQDIETFVLPNDNGIGTRTVPVVYSLGNAISNMSAVNTRVGLLLTLRIVTDASGKRRMLPPEPTYTWCARPGTLTPSYCSVPIREYSGKKDAWKIGSDYDNMMTSFERVQAKTGVRDASAPHTQHSARQP